MKQPFDQTHSAPATRGYVPGTPRLAYWHAGHGESVIFLHGIGGNSDNWREQLQHFSGRFRAIAWDARGYGASDDYDGPCEFSDFSADLLRLIDHLGIAKAHFVGLSMGGRILMDFGVRHPERIQSLVIAASFPSFGHALEPHEKDNFMRLRREPLRNGKSFSDLAPALVASLAGPHATPDMRARLRDSIERLHPESYLKTLESTLEFDRTDTLCQIAAPTLLLYGGLDKLVPPESGKLVSQLMPNARPIVIENSGHLINIEAPGPFNQAVEAFLDDHPIKKEGQPCSPNA